MENVDHREDWNRFARDILRVRLDREQRRIVDSVQHNRRTSVRSGHARGKDYVAAVISLCFLYNKYPSKVINTAPTGRQVSAIMMTEIKRIWQNAVSLGGEVQSTRIIMADDPDWYMIGFKASDRSPESWTGFHSQNILVVVTEASGIEQDTFNAIDGVLTGETSRLLLIFNPTRTTGEAYNSTRSPLYSKHRLNCLNAPNVRAKKILIPGQVDYEWVREKIGMPGWCHEIAAESADPITMHDFRFDGLWYRPSDLFLVKVMGEFPREGESQLIPMAWIEAANNRWQERRETAERKAGEQRLGVDVAGMGNDKTVFCQRYGNFVDAFRVFNKCDHMETAGRIKNTLAAHTGDVAFIDTIGEGSGVYSRCKELGVRAVSAKFSESTNGRRDLTGQREFVNMRAWCYWAVRDALDPKLGGDLALPPDDELAQELTAIEWEVRSDGKIKLIDKDKIKEVIGRSPDKGDSVALSYWPLSVAWGFVAKGDR